MVASIIEVSNLHEVAEGVGDVIAVVAFAGTIIRLVRKYLVKQSVERSWWSHPAVLMTVMALVAWVVFLLSELGQFRPPQPYGLTPELRAKLIELMQEPDTKRLLKWQTNLMIVWPHGDDDAEPFAWQLRNIFDEMERSDAKNFRFQATLRCFEYLHPDDNSCAAKEMATVQRREGDIEPGITVGVNDPMFPPADAVTLNGLLLRAGFHSRIGFMPQDTFNRYVPFALFVGRRPK